MHGEAIGRGLAVQAPVRKKETDYNVEMAISNEAFMVSKRRRKFAVLRFDAWEISVGVVLAVPQRVSQCERRTQFGCEGYCGSCSVERSADRCRLRARSGTG